jgi:Protein of unknown function (DUF1302)
MEPRKFASITIFLILCLLTIRPWVVSAGSDVNLEAVLGGFEDKTEPSSKETLDSVLEGFAEEEKRTPDALNQASLVAPSRFSIDGYLKFGTSYNFSHEAPAKNETDWRGFSRLRTELQIDFDSKFSNSWQARVGVKGFYDTVYALQGREEYTQAVLDEYEDELELREVYLIGRVFDNLDIKAGRQIVVWGKSDNIRVTDVLNPLDIREPGLTDIEDLRLPVTMTKLDYYAGNWNLTGIAMHEIRFDKTPVYGHDFYPGTGPQPPEVKPTETLSNTEWAFSIGGIFSGWDINFYYAHFFNDTPHFENVPDGLVPETHRKHARLNMFGIAYNRALGNWLLKAEAAFLDGLEYTNRLDSIYSRIDGLIGMEYSGFKETTLSLEIANRHINGHDADLESMPDGVCRDMFQAVLRYNQDFLNDTITLTLLASIFDPADADGAFERLSLEYDLTDTVQIRGGVVLYQSGDLFNMQRIGDNDRLFFEALYNF